MVEKWDGEIRRAHTLARPSGSLSANVPCESLRDSSVHFLSPSGCVNHGLHGFHGLSYDL